MYIEPNLYDQILRVMPIPCVDLLITDPSDRVLLVKRKNDPMKDQWWFPGGRVLFNETREQAARRKLYEECGLNPKTVNETGTFDMLLPLTGTDQISHGITTLFHVTVGRDSQVTIDDQSIGAEWRLPEEWLKEDLHDFIKTNLIIEKNKA
jgi:colanic acid biosynthesis protein WcaH